MIIRIRFSAKNTKNIVLELETIANEIQSGRTFGLGWQISPEKEGDRCVFRNAAGEYRLGGEVPVRQPDR